MRSLMRSQTGHAAKLALVVGAAAVLAVQAGRGAAGEALAPDGQAQRGAAVYAFSCAVCHGSSGQGFEEAVAAFPVDYQQCTRCHQPQNAPRMPGSQVGLSVMAFSLGEPPPLADAQALARFGTARGLHEYVRSTMPRWAPGSLDDESYLDVTVHLLRLAGVLGDADDLGREGLDALPLH